MSDHYKEELKKVFKLDSAKNIADKLVGGHGDPNMKGASGSLGLIAGTAGRVVKAFANTARQYMSGGKAAKKVSNFRPLVTGNRVYDRKSISDAFAQRFGRPQNVIKKATEGQGELAALKKAKNMASKAGPKNSVKGLTESSTRRTNFTSGR
tara:strand:+ start:481 stop:936 length:456 start_codon:yes stop_codon:yes gene_type:complete